jgi:hypothetical protein
VRPRRAAGLLTQASRQPSPGPVQAGLDRSCRDAEGHGRPLHVQAGPGARFDDLALVAGQPARGLAQLGHQALAVDGRGHRIGVIRRELVIWVQTRQSSPIPPAGTRCVARRVAGDAQQPGQSRLAVEHHLAALAPGQQEDSRGEILGLGPVRGPAEEMVVDRRRVPVEKLAERRTVAAAGEPPELAIARAVRRDHSPHAPIVSGYGARVPRQKTAAGHQACRGYI